MKFASYSPLVLLSSLLVSSCTVKLTTPFDQSPVPAAPDYSNPDHWAALPTKTDPADELPSGAVAASLIERGKLADRQKDAEVDVFFVHPTIYTYQPKVPNKWNGDVEDFTLNARTDSSTIRHQASIFNGVGKVYAPRYRQGHYYGYLTPDKDDADQAFAIAYADVKKAFFYFLKNYSAGRPFVIASHSQGTQHMAKLLKEVVDGSSYQDQLIAAYLIGMPVPAEGYFENILPCTSANQTGCWIGWNVRGRNFYQRNHKATQRYALAVNPITFDDNQPKADYDLQLGTVNGDYELLVSGKVNAEVHEGMIWIDTPKIPGAGLILNKNWHRADYNLYWLDVRRNAQLRVQEYLRSH